MCCVTLGVNTDSTFHVKDPSLPSGVSRKGTKFLKTFANGKTKTLAYKNDEVESEGSVGEEHHDDNHSSDGCSDVALGEPVARPLEQASLAACVSQRVEEVVPKQAYTSSSTTQSSLKAWFKIQA